MTKQDAITRLRETAIVASGKVGTKEAETVLQNLKDDLETQNEAIQRAVQSGLAAVDRARKKQERLKAIHSKLRKSATPGSSPESR